MRLIFGCQNCGTHYLPPEGLKYRDGSRASAVWCSPCQQANAAKGIEENPVHAAVALHAAQAMAAALAARSQSADEAVRPARRPSRPARTHLGQKRPGGARSRLG